jgi:TPR repeat protein
MDAQSTLMAARDALDRSAFVEAENILLPLAEQENFEAQSLLGIVFQIQGNLDAAIHWLEKAALGGNGCGAHNLGVAYLPSNPEEGKKWLQLAYDLGFESEVASDPLWFKR